MSRFALLIPVLVTALTTVFIALLTGQGLRETLSERDEPLQATLSEAIQLQRSGKSAWVQISDATADCTRFAPFHTSGADGRSEHGAHFIAFNAARDTEIAVVAFDLRSCDYMGRVHWIGMIKKIYADERQDFAARFASHRLPVAEMEKQAFWLCSGCQPARNHFGVFVMALATLFMGLLTWAFWRQWRRSAPSAIAIKAAQSAIQPMPVRKDVGTAKPPTRPQRPRKRKAK